MNSQFAQRFWDKTDESAVGCLEWQGCRSKQGYGRVAIENGRSALAHRVAYELEFGTIPEGMQVLHECDNPACVNPDYLFTGTQQDNMDDCQSKGRLAKHEWHSKAKLTWPEIHEIRYRASIGESQRSLARTYGVRFQTIGQVVRNETWVTS